jgi:hypothetical protein
MVSVGIGDPSRMTQISRSSLITPDDSKIERGTPVPILAGKWVDAGLAGVKIVVSPQERALASEHDVC